MSRLSADDLLIFHENYAPIFDFRLISYKSKLLSSPLVGEPLLKANCEIKREGTCSDRVAEYEQMNFARSTQDSAKCEAEKVATTSHVYVLIIILLL